jgi:hypothetical protein
MSAVRHATALIAAALVLAPASASAQKNASTTSGSPWGVVNDVWVDYDVYDAGVKGMLIHIDFDVDNGLNIPSRAVAYFSYAGGEPLQDFDGNYTTSDGQASAGTDFTPIYASANFSDLRIFMPYDELHMAPGSSDLEFYIEMYTHHDGTVIAEAGPYSFTFEQGK